jgi:hypothetical protein
MCFPARVPAALAVLAALLAPPARAELVPFKPKRALLASSTEQVVAAGSKDLFREGVLLTGRPGCVVVRFSGEIAGSNADADPHVVASFEIAVGDVLAAAPVFHEAPTRALPRLVSIDGYACGVSAGPKEVSVRVRAEGGDEVTVGARTLEVWTGKGRSAPAALPRAPAGRR